jgi:colanic acid biosynthesis glycosyl transferase WcaI
MNILIYGINFAPELVGIGKYTSELVEWLTTNHKVSVITAPKYYPEWKLDSRFRRWWYQRQNDGDVKIYRCPIWVPKRPSGIKRILHLLSFSITSFPVLLKFAFNKPDIIIAIAPPFTSAPFILFTSWIARCKRLLHIQDFEIDAAFTLGILKNSYLNQFLLWIEKVFLKRFDVISTISPFMLNKLVHKIDVENKAFLFPNWVDTDVIKPIDNSQSFRKELDLPEKTKICLYSGNIGFKQGLDTLLAVAEQFKDEKRDILFLIVGDGAAKDSLMEFINSKDLINVSLRPIQPNDTFQKLLATADLHLVLQSSSIADYVMPSKLTTILSIGGCSLITAQRNTQLGQLVSEYQIGKLIEPDSTTHLYNGINSILEDESVRLNISKNARKYAVNSLSKELILNEFETKISELVNNVK